MILFGGGGEADVIAKTPPLVKICSRAFVPELVKRALPGFTLPHLQTPPTGYIGEAGDAIFFHQQSRAVLGPHCEDASGVYVPGEFADPEIELLVVIGS